MTIQDLYDWGKEHNCLDYEIEVRCGTCGDRNVVYCPIEEYLYEYIEEKTKTVIL